MNRAAALLLLFAAAPAQAQLLWENVKAGMTAEEVRRAQPRAQVYDDADRLFNGARCLLRIGHYDFGGRSLTVCFYMLDGRLHQVTLKLRPAVESDFAALSALLRERYGPARQTADPICLREILESCRVEWTLPDGIELSILWGNLLAGDGYLNINYQQPRRPYPIRR